MDLLTLHRGHVLKVRTLSQNLDHKTLEGIHLAFLAATDILSGETFQTEVRPELFVAVTRKHEAKRASDMQNMHMTLLLRWMISVFDVIGSHTACSTHHFTLRNQYCKCSRLLVSVYSFWWLGNWYLKVSEWLTKHSNNSTCFRDSLIIDGYALIETLIIFLHPLDGQNPILSQSDTCNTQSLSQTDNV